MLGVSQTVSILRSGFQVPQMKSTYNLLCQERQLRAWFSLCFWLSLLQSEEQNKHSLVPPPLTFHSGSSWKLSWFWKYPLWSPINKLHLPQGPDKNWTRCSWEIQALTGYVYVCILYTWATVLQGKKKQSYVYVIFMGGSERIYLIYPTEEDITVVQKGVHKMSLL